MTQQTLHAPDTVAHGGFRVTLNPAARSERDRAAVLAAPGFGAHFTDHMVLVDFSERNGWHDRRVVPYGPLPMDPAATALQYGQEIFEGLKLYRHRDGHLRLFRPDMNARRFAASAARLALPAVPTGLFVESIRQLALVDAAWVPDRPGDSLYVRPFVIGTEALLGVRPARHATYGVIASPAGSYFDDAESGISLWLSPSHSRAGAGGTGAAKCGGNYAAALVAQTEAKAHGCQQVLFTDAATRTWVEEAGSMNIFFVFADGTLVTPPLNGAILAGVTRDSVIELARDRGHRVEERPISIAEWKATATTGELTEVFAAGTAAVITPIAELVTEDTVIATRASGSASMARELRAQLTGIQHGTIPDRRGWLLDLGPARR
ncbi:branched-chain amino acid aminotransferase [Mycobacterium sp. G7A2]|uniref:branched-chain amino acid aminotransferase n=1 Tax=Mycobacterium sp. G7A2 TaxID=3317307 RepID=UPI0035A977A7